MTLDRLRTLTRTAPFREFAAKHPVDAAKVKAELAGERRPRPASGYARILVELAREAQPAPKPKPAAQVDLGVFAGRGVFLRDPRSGSEVEKCREWAAAGYKWVAFNVRDFAPWTYQLWGRIAAVERGLQIVHWARCHTADDVEQLVLDSWARIALIVNLEQEPGDPRWRLTAQDVKDALKGYDGQVAFSTEPWLPDNFEWAALSEHVCLPQAFLNEDARFTPETVTARARQLGFTRVAPTFGVYHGQAGRPGRAAYEWDGPFSVYTGDDLSVAEIKEWT